MRGLERLLCNQVYFFPMTFLFILVTWSCNALNPPDTRYIFLHITYKLTKLSFYHRETKYLLEKLQLTREEPALIDAADAHVPYFAEKCLPLLPPAEKQAILAAGQPDLVWMAERTHAVWTAGNY